jgi:2'-5' RNA ligase
MPDPKKYKSTEKTKYMEDCMHDTLHVEKKPRDQAIAVCLNRWREEHGESKVASKIEKIVQQAKKVNDKLKIFLGGSCKDNSWREELEKEYGDTFFFIDPYDKDWSAEDNIYDELAGMINSDYVIFYKGGDLTEREKDFLKNIGRSDNLVKEFKNLADIKKFFEKRIAIKKKELKPLSGILKKFAHRLSKEAIPADLNKYKHDADFYFENLDTESRKKVLADFVSGKTINIPNIVIGDKVLVKQSINRFDFDRHGYEELARQMRALALRPAVNPELSYDPEDSSYYKATEIKTVISPVSVPEQTVPVMSKVAKVGATYSKSSTQIDLPEQLAQEIMSWGKANIPDKDLYTKDADKGREDEIHTTLFYGIVEDNEKALEKLRSIFAGVAPFECRLGIITAFKDKKEYDVLKIDVESSEMVRLHYLIEGEIKNKNDFPTYAAHLTVAYLKKGKADRLIGDDKFRGVTFKVTEIVFSTKDHNKITIPLGC